MPKYLQIETDLSVHGLPGLQGKFTPVDFKLPDAVASGMQSAIDLADGFDAVPGDHQLETKGSLPINFKLPIFGSVKESVDCVGILRIVDKPA